MKSAAASAAAAAVKDQITSAREPSVSRTHDIVVVTEGGVEQKRDPELEKLANIPVFLPLLKGSLNIPNVTDGESLDKLDTRQVLLLCIRYEEHLKQCAEAVAFDQNALCVRIKEASDWSTVAVIGSYKYHTHSLTFIANCVLISFQ